MTRHQLKLMGPPSLAELDAVGIETPVRLSRANLSLLALVVMNGTGSALSRPLVAESLWPDTPPEKSASRLSSALSRLQRAMGPSARRVLSTERGRIGLPPDTRLQVDILDVAACTARLSQSDLSDWQKPDVAALEAAINLRRGAFLDGLDGDWVLAARQRCADIYEAGLEALIRFHRHRGHVERSIAAARTLVRQDPYREDVQAVLVELYGQKGQRNRAIAQYTSCRDLLKTDLGIEPSPNLTTSLRSALGPRAEKSNPDLVPMLQTIERTVSRLARQVSEIHSMLDHHGADMERRPSKPEPALSD